LALTLGVHMSTSEGTVIQTGRRRRRRHSALFKAEAVGACQQSGVSIAAVALARGLNANMLRDRVSVNANLNLTPWGQYYVGANTRPLREMAFATGGNRNTRLPLARALW
jgi:hypothetical protein